MMKKYIPAFLILLFLFGCSEEHIEPNEQELDISQLVLPKEDFKSIISAINNYMNTSSPKYGLAGSESSTSDSDLSEILDPMVGNGEVILDGVHGVIYQSDFYANMTATEQESLHQEIDQLTDPQLVELSLTFNAIYYSDDIVASQIDMDDIMACLAVATGIAAIRDLYINTMAGGSITSMLGALKHIGRRYLGWIGVAGMIYSFAECLYDIE